MSSADTIREMQRLSAERGRLIEATGFDTYTQALEFIIEARSVSDMADRACIQKPRNPEAERRFNEAMLKAMKGNMGDAEFTAAVLKMI